MSASFPHVFEQIVVFFSGCTMHTDRISYELVVSETGDFFLLDLQGSVRNDGTIYIYLYIFHQCKYGELFIC